MGLETPTQSETNEAPVSKDLVKNAEMRKEELKKLSGEAYGKRLEQVEEDLDKADASFSEVIYSDGQIAGMTKIAFETISKALEEGDLTVAQERLAELNEYKKNMGTHRNMHPARVKAVMQGVEQFLEQFDLKKYVILKESMRTDDIKRAINIGYEAKMWELTNRI